MLVKTKQAAQRRRAERRAHRKLEAQFKNLTDPTFLDRALAAEVKGK